MNCDQMALVSENEAGRVGLKMDSLFVETARIVNNKFFEIIVKINQ